jgi:mannosyltransferase
MSRNRLYLLLFASLMGLGAIVRIMYLWAPDFWYDEGFTVLLSRLPFNRMMIATAGDTHPPAYYVLIWGWVRLVGESEFSIRLPSVLFGLAAIPVLWALMRHWLVDNLTQWVVLVMMALGPFQVYFSQEARMYTLLQLLYLLAVLALYRRWAWLLTLANLLMLYTHNYGLFYLASLGLWWAWLMWDHGARPWQLIRAMVQDRPMMVAFGGPVLAWLPWALVLSGQMAEVSQGYWIEPVTLGSIVYTLELFVFGPFTRQWVLVGAMVSTGLALYALIRFAEQRRPIGNPATPALWFAMLPMLLAVLASVLWQPVYLFRGLIGTVPFWYLALARPVMASSRRWAAAAMVLPMLLVGLVGYWSDIRDFKSTTRDVIASIRADWQPGDVLYSTNDGNWVMFSVYAPDVPMAMMPQCTGTDQDHGALSAMTRAALGVSQIELQQIDGQRAWVLWNWGAQTSGCNRDRAADLLRGNQPWLIVKESDFNSASIWLLTRQPASVR